MYATNASCCAVEKRSILLRCCAESRTKHHKSEASGCYSRRIGIKYTQVAAICTALLVDLEMATENDKQLVIDKFKLQRAREAKRLFETNIN